LWKLENGPERSSSLSQVYITIWDNGVLDRTNIDTRPVKLKGKKNWEEGVEELMEEGGPEGVTVFEFVGQ